MPVMIDPCQVPEVIVPTVAMSVPINLLAAMEPASMALVTLLDPMAVAKDPAVVVTSPVKAGKLTADRTPLCKSVSLHLEVVLSYIKLTDWSANKVTSEPVAVWIRLPAVELAFSFFKTMELDPTLVILMTRPVAVPARPVMFLKASEDNLQLLLVVEGL